MFFDCNHVLFSRTIVHGTSRKRYDMTGTASGQSLSFQTGGGAVSLSSGGGAITMDAGGGSFALKGQVDINS